MKQYFTNSKLKPHYLVPAFLITGFLFTAALSSSGFNTSPLLQNTDNFILFSQEEVRIEEETQVSSGDIGSNNKVDINKEVIINGNLFADEITVDKDTQINGNASFNKLKIKKDSQIFGEQTTPISLPIANISQIVDSEPGTQDFKFEGQDNTLNAGDFGKITLEEDSRLILSGGFYIIDKLILKNNSTVIFQDTTKLDIKTKLRGGGNISILPGQNLTPDDLVINFAGTNFVHFGKQSFLNFKLIAPKAQVRLGKETIFRGQIIAEGIHIAKDSILSREEAFTKESDPEKVVIDEDGSEFLVNEIMINLTESATFAEAQEIANLVDGRVVGFVKSANAYLLEVSTNTTEELSDKIQTIRNFGDPFIEGVFRNYIFQLL